LEKAIGFAQDHEGTAKDYKLAPIDGQLRYVQTDGP
jgi:hypothetical protein